MFKLVTSNLLANEGRVRWNVRGTFCTDFARCDEPRSCAVLPQIAVCHLFDRAEKPYELSFCVVGAVGIEPTTSPV